MSKPTLVIKARIEEVPTIASFTIESYKRDLADFAAYKPAKYNASFLLNLQAKQTTVNNLIQPKQFTAEIKLITARIFKNTYNLREPLNFIEGYLADATGLTMAAKDFGISAVRKSIAKFDQEALSSTLAYLVQNLTDNMSALTAVGYTGTQHNSLKARKKALDDDNALQNKKISDRALLVKANGDTINQLAQAIKNIWADGKRLYKTSSKTKLADYTNSKLIARIRQETLRTKIVGTVTAADGSKLRDIKLIAKPVEGGRSKTTKPDKNNHYQLIGLKPSLLNITVHVKGKPPFIEQVLPVTNQTVTHHIKVPV